jgi:hypothetical protein
MRGEGSVSFLTAEEKMSRLLQVIGNPGVCGNERRPGCGAPIWWVSTKTGAPTPLNGDGTSHFATCPNAREFRLKQQKERIHYAQRQGNE